MSDKDIEIATMEAFIVSMKQVFKDKNLPTKNFANWMYIFGDMFFTRRAKRVCYIAAENLLRANIEKGTDAISQLISDSKN